MNELPFLMLEKALMWLTEIGIDRQHAHEKIREVALAAKEASKLAPISINSILSDVFFDPVSSFFCFKFYFVRDNNSDFGFLVTKKVILNY